MAQPQSSSGTDGPIAAWGESVPLSPGDTLRNGLSDMTLSVTLLAHEWQVRVARHPGAREETAWRQWCDSTLPEHDEGLERFARGNEAPRVALRPALADLPLIVRPNHPLHLPPGTDTTIYMSTLVWLQLLVGDDRRLMEVPVRQPSWTWMGADTMEGELCYASLTAARLEPDNLPRRPWRAMSAVRLRHEGDDYLTLDRFSFPAPIMPLFRQSEPGVDGAHSLWTPTLSIRCERDLATASLKVEATPPPEAGPCTALAPARQPVERNHLVRTMDRIFG
ncbi:hypothetical protein CK501_10315 [Halovibrio salipaludis]|uniref:Uncharacterized protein n=1 Tax=Halovibrio salipaludis TaxID=2032626 RepID=A0A2A2F5X5_9GAMM|nr:hypothetical protein [Halovibrio salipaludis]PAU80039.1 hypothetical protein CK501_10315 [Halovibrio salipaludis]